MDRHIRKAAVTLAAAVVLWTGLCPNRGYCRSPRLTDKMRVSVEWGYIQTLYNHHHYNINSSEGYRINENVGRFDAVPNANALIGVTYCPQKRFYMGLYSGYTGIYRDTRVFPFLLRLGLFHKDFSKDGFHTFAEGGIGICPPGHSSRSNAALFGLGEAYRMTLGGSWSLDFALKLTCAADAPPIANPEGAGYVPKQNIRSNRAEYFALGFSVALSF